MHGAQRCTALWSPQQSGAQRKRHQADRSRDAGAGRGCQRHSPRRVGVNSPKFWPLQALGLPKLPGLSGITASKPPRSRCTPPPPLLLLPRQLPSGKAPPGLGRLAPKLPDAFAAAAASSTAAMATARARILPLKCVCVRACGVCGCRRVATSAPATHGPDTGWAQCPTRHCPGSPASKKGEGPVKPLSTGRSWCAN